MTDDDGNMILESCGTTGNCFTAIKERIQNKIHVKFYHLRPPRRVYKKDENLMNLMHLMNLMNLMNLMHLEQCTENPC